ncbi:putative protein TPRXL [Colletotrichum tofieldiae]|nr:putative protein TPRXL [Colletotrichum tofieldiae]
MPTPNGSHSASAQSINPTSPPALSLIPLRLLPPRPLAPSPSSQGGWTKTLSGTRSPWVTTHGSDPSTSSNSPIARATTPRNSPGRPSARTSSLHLKLPPTFPLTTSRPSRRPLQESANTTARSATTLLRHARGSIPSAADSPRNCVSETPPTLSNAYAHSSPSWPLPASAVSKPVSTPSSSTPGTVPPPNTPLASAQILTSMPAGAGAGVRRVVGIRVQVSRAPVEIIRINRHCLFTAGSNVPSWNVGSALSPGTWAAGEGLKLSAPSAAARLEENGGWSG